MSPRSRMSRSLTSRGSQSIMSRESCSPKRRSQCPRHKSSGSRRSRGSYSGVKSQESVLDPKESPIFDEKDADFEDLIISDEVEEKTKDGANDLGLPKDYQNLLDDICSRFSYMERVEGF